MTTRNLRALLRPRAVAVVGASNRSGSIGRVLLQNLLGTGSDGPGFDGPILPVNPRHEAVLGVRAYADIEQLPVVPELAVIAIPAPGVPEMIDRLARRGTRGAVVISAGLGERGEDGRTLQQAALDAARPYLLRIVGPNSLGLLVPGIGLNASFAHLGAAPGRLAFLAQSGAIITSVLDWAAARGIGFSHMVSLGDMADVDFGDLLDYLANDPETHAILLYVEVVTHARKFMSAARAAARTKPVLVVKAGRHERSGHAAASHTGRMAGPDAEYDAAFRRAGMLRVAALEELFGAVETLALARPPAGPRLTILSNGGGTGVLAADALLDRGGELAELGGGTVERLDEILPRNWSRSNPIDIVGDANADRYARALEAVLEQRDGDGVLILHCPTAVSQGLEAARAVIETCRRYPDETVLTSWLGERTARAPREELRRHRVPSYDTPEQAVHAFLQMVEYRRSQELLMETPPSLPELFEADAERARAVLDGAAADGRVWLTDPEAKSVLEAYGIPVAKPELTTTPAEARAAAERLDAAVALKIVAPGILHKSDVGGVVLGLREPAEVERAAEEMLARARAARPDVEVTGFGVEPLIERRHARELIIGASSGGDFGPVILFGHGGTAVEVLDDTAVELPPLNLKLAHALMRRTRVFRELCGYRDVPSVDLDAVALALTRVSQLLVDLPRIVELDINPLLADEHGIVAVDARIRLDPELAAESSRLAIRPYPKELEREVDLPDGRRLLLRPILPEDEPALHEGFKRLTPDEIRARFFVPMKTLSHLMAARFTQIDYDREMALVLTERGIPGKAEIYGVVRLAADPDNRRAEFAVVVEQRYTGMGFGTLLMRSIIEHARSRGIGELVGDVLVDNARMRKLCASLGFSESTDPDSPGLVRVRLALGD